LNISLPIVMGGDFNLIRNNKERNHGSGDQRLMNLFNNFIGQFQLREIFVVELGLHGLINSNIQL
jgi:hypothetical protein